jgi:aryl-alcohol dehydrogenase-like predicted oxidoreductase
MLRRASSLGFGAIDTAPSYGDAEIVIGSSGVALPVHTKVDPEHEPAQSLARSLARLQRESVDVLYFHAPHIVLSDPTGAIERAVSLLGRGTAALGASVYEAHELAALIDDGRFGAAQVPLNVLDRRISPVLLESARARGISVFARSVFLQGLLLVAPEQLGPRFAPFADSVARFHAIASRSGVDAVTLALAWVRRLPLAGVLVGFETAEQAGTIACSFSRTLDAELLAELQGLPLPPQHWCDPRTWSS